MVEPVKAYCPMHADEQIDGVLVSDEFGYKFTCTRGKGHPGGGSYEWEQLPESPEFEGLTGLANELGLQTELPAALAQYKGQWVEYGVLERAYALAHPEDWAILVGKYGHRAVAAKRYTASAFLAATLSRLQSLGYLAYHGGPATGRWTYNSGISWWALDPETPWENRLSWDQSGADLTYVPGQTEV